MSKMHYLKEGGYYAVIQRKPLLRLIVLSSKALLFSFCYATIGLGAEILDVEIEHDGARYRLVSTTHFDAPQQDVFDTLTDYDQLARISETIKESHYLSPAEDGQQLVFTRLGACVLFYCKTIVKVERLELDTPCRIVTTAIPERSNVLFSRSEWLFTTEKDGGTIVVYQLEFEPGFWVPPIIGPLIIRNLLIKDGASAVQEIEAMAKRRAVAHDPDPTTAC